MTATPADELRAAAEKLRIAATAAAEHSGSTTWHSKPHFPELDSDFTTLTASPGRPLHGGGGGGRGAAPYMHAPISEYIALMGPGVGLALADWLDETARYASLYTSLTIATTGASPAVEDYDSLTRHALAVARPLLGATATTEEPTPVPAPCTDPCIACMTDESHDPAATEEPGR